MPQQPTKKKKARQFKIYAVRCPWCGKPNDFREVEYDLRTTQDAGAKVDCDHCGRLMKVVRIEPVKLITVVRFVPKTG